MVGGMETSCHVKVGVCAHAYVPFLHTHSGSNVQPGVMTHSLTQQLAGHICGVVPVLAWHLMVGLFSVAAAVRDSCHRC